MVGDLAGALVTYLGEEVDGADEFHEFDPLEEKCLLKILWTIFSVWGGSWKVHSVSMSLIVIGFP